MPKVLTISRACDTSNLAPVNSSLLSDSKMPFKSDPFKSKPLKDVFLKDDPDREDDAIFSRLWLLFSNAL